MQNIKNPVFRSMTDSTMFLGVPFEYAMFTAIVPVQISVFTGFFVTSGVVFITLWIVGVIMTKKDPRWIMVVKTIMLNKKTAPNLIKKEKRYVA